MTLYSDSNLTKIFKEIPNKNIFCINKRQTNIKDRNTLSIHYTDNHNKLCELKLKLKQGKLVNSWINKLNKRIKTAEFVFKFKENEELLENTLNRILSNPKEFYIKVQNLETIINYKYKENFFGQLKQKINPMNKYLINGDEDSYGDNDEGGDDFNNSKSNSKTVNLEEKEENKESNELNNVIFL